jgi:hypothetical protein
MAIATVDGPSFETIGEDAPWVITLGGPFGMDSGRTGEAMRRTRS